MNANVYLQKSKNREKFVREVFEKFEIKKELKETKRVLLKPNIVSFEPYPTTTSPEMLKILLELLLEQKKEVVVADAPAFDAGPSGEIIENHPLKKICDEFGVEMVNLNTQEFKKVKSPSFQLNVSTFPFQFDFIVSLPVLKSHSTTGITGALKNQFGLLDSEQRVKLHLPLPRQDIHKAIAELNLIFKIDLWIVDAIETLIKTNEVRHGGEKKELGYMLAGRDPVALDTEGLKLLKKVDPNLRDKSPEDILHLKWAIDLRLGKANYLL